MDKAKNALAVTEDIIIHLPEDQTLADELEENITATNENIEMAYEKGSLPSQLHKNKKTLFHIKNKCRSSVCCLVSEKMYCSFYMQ